MLLIVFSVGLHPSSHLMILSCDKNMLYIINRLQSRKNYIIGRHTLFYGCSAITFEQVIFDVYI